MPGRVFRRSVLCTSTQTAGQQRAGPTHRGRDWQVRSGARAFAFLMPWGVAPLLGRRQTSEY